MSTQPDASVPLVLNRGASPSGSEAQDEVADGKALSRGYFFMCCSALYQTLMSFFIRVAESAYDYPSLSAILIRAFVLTIFSIVYLSINGLFHELLLSRKLFTLLSLRGLFSALAGLFLFHALRYLPVGITMTVLYAYPAITSILAALFLQDPFTLPQLLTVALNFFGVALTSQGSYAFRENKDLALLGIVLALLSAVSGAIVFITVRAMGLRVHFVLGCLFSGIFYFPIFFFLGTHADVVAIFKNPTGTLFAILSGMAGFGSQVMLTRGLQLVSPGPAAVVRSLNVPMSLLLGLVFLSEKPSALSLVGIMLVLLSVASVAWQKQATFQQRAPYQPISTSHPCET